MARCVKLFILRRTYLNFYWPLAVSGITVILVNQFHNGALARFPHPSREIANFAYAFGLFALCRAALGFVPQMSNLLARSQEGHRVTLVFVMAAGVALMLPLLALGHTHLGAVFVSYVFDVHDDNLQEVLRYLRWFAPLVPVVALRQYTIGLLIQVQVTRIVTLLDLLRLAVLFVLLVAGLHLGWTPVTTLVAAEWTSSLVHLVLQVVAVLRVWGLPEVEAERIGFGDVFAFFWPVALTSTMFALSRPILYSFVSRGGEADVGVAALRVAFDFSLFFHQPLNQFRNLFATFGTSDLRGLRRFQTEVVLVVTGAMALVSFTPLDTFLFTDLLGVTGDVEAFAEQAFRVMCWLPLVIGLRNYFHGIALARLTTRAMAYGAVLRVGTITLLSWMVTVRGGLGHMGAALILILGFVVETLVVLLLLRRPRRQ